MHISIITISTPGASRCKTSGISLCRLSIGSRYAPPRFALITLIVIVAGLDFERASYETLLTSLDRIEALKAFTEKRKPVFRGE
jgi:hypothetical protein